jgi:hypothetical protein
VRVGSEKQNRIGSLMFTGASLKLGPTTLLLKVSTIKKKRGSKYYASGKCLVGFSGIGQL